jgi:hypothetical protein
MNTPFWAFSFDMYYPNGGIGDCVGQFADLESALVYLKKGYHDSAYVIDIRLPFGEIIVWSNL